MNKKQNEIWMCKAEKALQDKRVDIRTNATEIKDSYNGQTASLGVTIAMTGLRPALAIYLKVNDKCKNEILNAIAVMLGVEGDQPGKELFREILGTTSEQRLKERKKEIIECSVALKHVIRTYNLTKS